MKGTFFVSFFFIIDREYKIAETLRMLKNRVEKQSLGELKKTASFVMERIKVA